MSVTGFDNVKLSEFCYPALTTVHIPRDRETADHEVVIDPELCCGGRRGR